MNQAAEILKRLLQAGLTQTEIAKRTGIPQPRLSRWAGGWAPKSAHDALKLAELADEFFGGQPDPAAEDRAAA